MDISIFSAIEHSLQKETNSSLVYTTELRLDSLPSFWEIPLYEKSIGIALPALTLIMQTNANDEELKNILAFFEAYLSIRQYQDDMHDFMQDIQSGKCTRTVHTLLTQYAIVFPNKKSVSIITEKEILQKLFWDTVFISISREIEKLILQARRTIERMPIHYQISFETILRGVAQNHEKIKKEREQVIAFLNIYKK